MKLLIMGFQRMFNDIRKCCNKDEKKSHFVYLIQPKLCKKSISRRKTKKTHHVLISGLNLGGRMMSNFNFSAEFSKFPNSEHLYF